MTLRVNISRRDEYVLMTSDAQRFAGKADAAMPVPLGDVVDNGATRLTDNVLVATAGDVAISHDFHERLSARVDRHDDLGACVDSVRATIRELRADDRPGEPYEASGYLWSRGAIAGDFGVVLNGYTSDGRSAIVPFQTGAGDDVVYDEHPELVQFHSTIPYGIPDDDEAFQQFTVFPADPPIRAFDLTLAGAFVRAFRLHYRLGHRYPDRVSREIKCIVLGAWSPDEEPSLLSFVLGRDDLQGLERVLEMLTTPSPGVSRSRSLQTT